MPERETMQRAREDAREGKSPSTQAGEFVREEMDHIREGKTWSAINQAGNCHWAFEGAARGSEIAGAGIGSDSEESGAGY